MPAAVAEVLEDRVPVDRDVVDLHADAGRAQPVVHLAAPAVEDPDRVEVPASGRRRRDGPAAAARARRRAARRSGRTSSARRALNAASRRSWLAAQRAQHVGQPVVQARTRAPPGASRPRPGGAARRGRGPGRCCGTVRARVEQAGSRTGDRAALGRGQVLGREERERGEVGERADRPAAVASSRSSARRRRAAARRPARRPCAARRTRPGGRRSRPPAIDPGPGGDRRLGRGRVEVGVSSSTSAKTTVRAEQGGRGRGGHERHRRRDDLVAGADPGRRVRRRAAPPCRW